MFGPDKEKILEGLGDLAFLQKCGIKDEEKKEEVIKMLDHAIFLSECDAICDEAEAYDRYEDSY